MSWTVDGKRLGYIDAALSCDLERARGGVDDVVRLVVTAGEARRAWRETC